MRQHYRIKSDRILGMNGDTWQEKLAAEQSAKAKVDAERAALVAVKSGSRCVIL